VDGAATIVRSDRPAYTPDHVVLGAPKPYVQRQQKEPDDVDFRLRDLVVFMARGIVDHPDRVKVQIIDAGEDAGFELEVHADDLGHVIGKQGRTARSLRLALSAAAARERRRASLEIAD
jgi:predicted RNA-binding protein YlqC (UPF0109 family)